MWLRLEKTSRRITRKALHLRLLATLELGGVWRHRSRRNRIRCRRCLVGGWSDVRARIRSQCGAIGAFLDQPFRKSARQLNRSRTNVVLRRRGLYMRVIARLRDGGGGLLSEVGG